MQSFLFACLFYFLESGASAIKVYYSASILEMAQAGDFQKMIVSLGVALIACIGLFVIEFLNCKARLAYISETELFTKRSIMNSILKRPINKFRLKDDAYYFNLLTSDIDTYRTDFLSNKLLIVSWVSYTISSSVMLYKLNPWLLVTGIILAAIPICTNGLFTNISKKAKNNVSETSEQHAGVLQEIIKGYETIRMDNSSPHIEKRFDIFFVAKRKAMNHYSFVQSMDMQAFYTFASLTTLIGVGVGGYLVIDGKLSAVMMLAAQSYFATLSNAISNITAYVVEMRATKDIRAKIKRESKTVSKTGTQPLVEGDISYENVGFSFEGHKLFSNFSFTFHPGKAYAIIGESGCGKSTLIKMLLKYYDRYSGAIKVSGKDIKSISEDELYQHIGVVDQTAYLFNASLYDNITLFSGYPKENSAEYQQLLAKFKLQKLAEQVGNQKLGDFGEKISGGERQRINIARAMRTKKPIMIFDEPTTGLDPENSKVINQIILNQTDIMRIVITHDRSEEYLSQFDAVISL